MPAAKKKATPAAENTVFEDYTAKATASVQENIEKLTTAASDMSEIGKDNYEAVVESATIYAKGVEEVATEQANFARESVENTVEQLKKVSSIKSPQEFFELQTDFVRSAFEANMSQFSKIAEMWASTTRESAEPISKRYSAVVEKAQSYGL